MVGNRKGLAFDIEARDKFSQVFDKLDRKLKVMPGLMRGLKAGFTAIAAGVAALGAGLVAQAVKMQEVAEQIGDLSQRLGASTEALSQYRFAAEAAGVSFETLTMGLQRMTRRISEASLGSGEAKDALLELGLSAERMKSLRPEQQFELLADRLASVKEPADRVRLAMRLFDSEGVALLQMMGNGADGIRRWREEADRLGITMTEDMVQAAQRSKLELLNLRTAFEGLAIRLLNYVGPALAEIARWFSETLPNAMNGTRNLLYDFERHNLNVARNILSTLAGLAKKLADLPGMIFQDKYLEMYYRLSDAAIAYGTAIHTLDEEHRKSVESSNALFEALNVTVPGLYDVSSAALAARDGLDQLSASMDMLEEGMTLDFMEAFDEDARRIFDSVRTPLEKYQASIENLNNHLAAGSINQETYSRAVVQAQEAFENADPAMQKAKQRADEFGRAFESNLERAILSGDKFSDVLKNLGKDIAALVLRMTITAPLASAISSGFSSIFSGFAFAGGGIMSGDGPVPLRRYASGGIASSPQLAMFGEGTRPEAYVPLPDGRSIPVTMRGGGGSSAPQITYNIDARGAEAGVEQRILAVLRQEEPRIVSRAVRESVDTVSSRADQGGAFARSVGRRG
jgi:hypothetical protein